MIGALPKSLDVCGIEYAIRSDYRDCLNIMEAFNDSELSDYNKQLVMLEILYEDCEKIPGDAKLEAIKKAAWFLNCGQEFKKSKDQPRLMDWIQDEQLYFPAINNVAKREVRADEYCHWWTFIGLYTSIDGDSSFSAITNIRRKLVNGEKLEKYEKKFYAENKELIDLRCKQDEYDQMIKVLRGE